MEKVDLNSLNDSFAASFDFMKVFMWIFRIGYAKEIYPITFLL
ncbi:hypothetical protein [Bartonella sp. WD16.2]|nr:hypothetical protein [Bartonella sp. WD16.2]AQX19518.1 hypothetical protein BWD162_003860 [Bartonella sp. WD16.2]